MRSRLVFLRAAWRWLIMASYPVPPKLLRPFVPVGTELDFFEGQAFASVIGFRFLDTRLLGVGVPGHRDFTEVNLRFYVRRRTAEGWRRGTVFISEVVPKPAISAVANALYGEQYQTLPTRYDLRRTPGALRVAYAWKTTRWNRLTATADPDAVPLQPGSKEHFVAEHYFGYSRAPGWLGGRTREYAVEHPPWQIHPVQSCRLDADAAEMYGAAWAPYLTETPDNAFVAVGSPVLIRTFQTLPSK